MIFLELSSRSEARPPALFVDVNLGFGRLERITMFDDDSPEKVAQEFSKQHSKILCG